MSWLCYIVIIFALLLAFAADPTFFVILAGGGLGIYILYKLLKRNRSSSVNLNRIFHANKDPSPSIITKLLTKKGILKKIARILTLAGALWGFFHYMDKYMFIFTNQVLLNPSHLYHVIINYLGLVIAWLGLYMVAKPDHPIPWNWVSLLIVGGMLVVFSCPIPGMLVFGGAFMEFIDHTPSKQQNEEKPKEIITQ